MPSRKPPRPTLQAAQRLSVALQELLQLDHFLKGTVLKRMMECGKPQCAFHRDPAQRHGPYFEWSYKAAGEARPSASNSAPKGAPLYQAATRQHRKLKTVLARLERLSRTALAQLAKQKTGRPGKDCLHQKNTLFSAKATPWTLSRVRSVRCAQRRILVMKNPG